MRYYGWPPVRISKHLLKNERTHGSCASGFMVPRDPVLIKNTPARLYFYVAVNLIDVKTKYYEDRRGLEQEGVEALLFE